MELLAKFMAFATKLLTESAVYIAAVNGLLLALIAFFVLVPGKQPEAFLQKVVDFIAKLSLKKKE